MNQFDHLSHTYEVIERIGSGGGGTVYKAYHKRLKKDVVIKKVHDQVKDIINCRTEIDILKNLHHSYIPQVLDFLDIEGNVYTVMEFIPGKSLSQLLDEGRRFSQKEIIKWAKQLAEALEYLHMQNPPIIHCDIKPANIMLTPKGDIFLIDFNISSIIGEKNFQTVGFSEGYSPPEQHPHLINKKTDKHPVKEDVTERFEHKLTGERTELHSREQQEYSQQTEYYNRNEIQNYTLHYNHSTDNEDEGTNKDSEIDNDSSYIVKIDERSDIYSLGATLYHLVTGEKPSYSLENINIFELEGIKISDGLKHIIFKAMKNNPDKRYQNTSKLLKALRQINKLDSRYKRFIIQQEIITLILVILFSVSILFIFYGHKTIKKEKVEKYDCLITNLIELKEEKDYKVFEDTYNQAIKLFPGKVNAYYYKALSLYEQGLYEDGITYIQEQIFDKNLIGEDSHMQANIYFILANCYFELEDYDYATVNFKNAIDYYSDNSEFYRDYAIALVRLNKIDEASAVLENAILKGLTEDCIYLVKGEIDFANQSYLTAIDNFTKCIKITNSDYIKNRAYVMCSKVYETTENQIDDSQIKNIRLLEEAKLELPMDMTIIVNARLAEAYVEYGTLMNNCEYYQKAIDLFNFTIKMGWDNYNTHNSLSLLYRQLNDYENASKELKLMQTQYPENYNTYKRFAYLELDIQGEKQNEQRDYSQFKEYYDKAFALYEKEKQNNKNDAEMDYLNNIYNELVSGNWLFKEE